MGDAAEEAAAERLEEESGFGGLLYFAASLTLDINPFVTYLLNSKSECLECTEDRSTFIVISCLITIRIVCNLIVVVSVV